jgi:hypothetical protein
MLLVALNGFIGAPGVITVVYPMVVNVTLLTSLAPPPEEPDDEQAATSDADVTAARVIEPNLSLRMFTAHLLDPLIQEGWETLTLQRVGKNITKNDENSSMGNMYRLVNASSTVPPGGRRGPANRQARKRVVPATVCGDGDDAEQQHVLDDLEFSRGGAGRPRATRYPAAGRG